MLRREEIEQILERASRVDKKYELFGASTHKYKLNPPINASFVRSIEEKYGFTFPEDYFQFITEVGDGGAGPDYGIQPFTDFLQEGKDSYSKRYWEEYHYSLAKPFVPRPMEAHEVEEFAIATKEAYERNPDNYLICEEDFETRFCDTDGYFTLGTHGCQWDFGMIISGERRGQIFDTDNEGAYGFLANSFTEFYQRWLDRLADTEGLQKELEYRRELRRKISRIV